MDPSRTKNALGAPSHLFRGSPAAVAEALRQQGLTCVQLTPNFPGLSFHEPGAITPERCRHAADAFRTAGVAIACLSGYIHLMDADLEHRHRGIVRLHALIRHCRDFGTTRIVTETGSLCPGIVHPPNRSQETWIELRLIVAEALRVAADHGVTVLLKPGSTHVLAAVEDAVRLREELPFANLGFVMDPACFLLESPPCAWRDELERLFERLGPWAPLLHAKDLRCVGEERTTPRVGLGNLDYGLILRLLRRYQPEAPIILENLRPEEVAPAKAFIERFPAEG
jgi:sugar phosphate isomerase/epimerase